MYQRRNSFLLNYNRTGYRFLKRCSKDSEDQGGSNQKKISLKFCNIQWISFSKFHFSFWLTLLIRLMILNHVKLGPAVTFTKYRTMVISLIFLPKIIIWNKMAFPPRNLLKLAELEVNELKITFSRNINQYLFLQPIHYCLI